MRFSFNEVLKTISLILVTILIGNQLAHSQPSTHLLSKENLSAPIKSGSQQGALFSNEVILEMLDERGYTEGIIHEPLVDMFYANEQYQLRNPKKIKAPSKKKIGRIINRLKLFRYLFQHYPSTLFLGIPSLFAYLFLASFSFSVWYVIKIYIAYVSGKYIGKLLSALLAKREQALLYAIYFEKLFKPKNYKNWFEDLPEVRSIKYRLQKEGITPLWDNPQYETYYGFNAYDKQVYEINKPLYQIMTELSLAEFIGYKENGKIHFGEREGALFDGRKTSRRFFSINHDFIKKVQSQDISLEEAILFHSRLLSYIKRNATKARADLNHRIELLESKEKIKFENHVRVNIWKRDPWTDLGEAKQFKACAFLGQEHEYAILNMMENKCITCLDFHLPNGQKVRATLGAAFYQTPQGDIRKAMLVATLEGHHNPRYSSLYLQALKDYAKRTGFDDLFLNTKMFTKNTFELSKLLKKQKYKQKRVYLSLFDTSRKEFLESFQSFNLGNNLIYLRLLIELSFRKSWIRKKLTGWLSNLASLFLITTRTKTKGLAKGYLVELDLLPSQDSPLVKNKISKKPLNNSHNATDSAFHSAA